MASMKCPKCGRLLDVADSVPGDRLTCVCGNVTKVPRVSNKLVYTIVAAVSVLLVCPCLLTALAIPNYIRFGLRARQAECKSNLKSWYTMQRIQFMNREVYEPSFPELGFAPEPSNRYAYFVGAGPVDARGGGRMDVVAEARGIGVDTLRFPELKALTLESLPAPVARKVGLQGQCPQCEITLACAGNVDQDETLDVWVISTGRVEGLRDVNGEPVEPGVPALIVNDVVQ